MAQTVAGFQGSISETQEANRFYRMGITAVVDSSSELKVTSTGIRTMSIAPGECMTCGVYFSETVAQTVQLPPNTGSTRYDIVGLRFTWAGASSSVSVFSKQGTPGSTNLPSLTRTPGGTYEMPLAVVRVRQNAASISADDVYDVRVWGGNGGAYQSGSTVYINTVDVPIGAEIQAGGNTYRVTANVAGNITTSLVSAGSIPWVAYDPVLSSEADGTCSLGTGGVRRGYYQVKDDTCYVIFEIRKGTTGQNFGRGQFRVALPPGYRPSADLTDQFGDGMEYTTMGDGSYYWQVKYLIRNDQNNYVKVFVTTSGADARLVPAMSGSVADGAGGGRPIILDAPGGTQVWAEPTVLTGYLSYKLAP